MEEIVVQCWLVITLKNKNMETRIERGIILQLYHAVYYRLVFKDGTDLEFVISLN
jgi:hypothetical protein